MALASWSKSSLEYGKKVVSSGLEGARSGREAFLDGKSLDSFLNQSVHDAFIPAVVGACVGALSGSSYKLRKSSGQSLLCGLLGGVAGFAAGVAWTNRRLAASIASGALKNVNKVRDEHWFEKHPIDYA
jgi:hypothetical protein